MKIVWWEEKHFRVLKSIQFTFAHIILKQVVNFWKSKPFYPSCIDLRGHRVMTVALLDRTRNSPQLYCLFLASSDPAQEVNGYFPMAPLLASLFSFLTEVMKYIWLRKGRGHPLLAVAEHLRDQWDCEY